MNKLKKRIASIITAAAVAFGSIGALPQLPQTVGFVVPAYADSTAITTWSGLKTALSADGTVTLTQDITAGDGDTALEVPSGKTVTLDLNGHTISRGLTTATENGYVIKVSGNLTLTDNGSGEGKITGGYNSSYCGGVYVDVNGTFTMTGGTISGNSTYLTNGGGVFVDSNATFTMTGGTISGNNVIGSNGGGVLVAGNAKFEMSGGTISGNSASASNATCRGGGVCVKPTGTFTMSGGTISGNNTTTYGNGNGGGVYVYSGATFNLSGTPKITDNVKDGTLDEGVYTGDTANNVFLDDETIKITGALSSGAKIGVSNTGVFAEKDGNYSGLTESDVSKFSYDGTGYHPIINDDGKAEFVRTLSWSDLQSKFNSASENETIKLLQDYTAGEGDNALVIPAGKKIVIDLNGHTINRELSSGTFNGHVIIVNGELTLEDSSESKAGKITGGYTNSSGGGVGISGGTFTMNGGAISGNHATNNGGGVFLNGGKFIMNGGAISGNTANGSGGGVFVNSGVFTMNGGTISGNTATDTGTSDCGGGGVYMLDGEINLKGGTITGNNTAENGGGLYYRNGVLNISGTPVVKDNVKGGTKSETTGLYTGGTANNVYLNNNMGIPLYVTGALTGDAEIYINKPSGVFAQGSTNPKYILTTADMTHFRCDDSDYAPGRNSDGKGVMLESWAGLQKRLDSANTESSSPTEITLDHDYLAGATDSALEIKSGTYVTLDLNGHTLDRGLYNSSMTQEQAADNAKENGYVIFVDGTLNLKDTGTDHNGKITGGNNSKYGGGLSVTAGSTFNMTGGTISGNHAKCGCGVNVEGIFNMSGGTISGNNSTDCGGGVYVVSTGGFTMSGGTITGNTAAKGGSGVYAGYRNFSISGSPVVTGNTGDDVLLLTGYSKLYVIGALTENASIGVKLLDRENNVTTGMFAYAASDYNGGKLNNSDIAHFTSTESILEVSMNDNGEAELVSAPVEPVSTSYVYNGITTNVPDAIPLNRFMTTLSEGTYVVNSDVNFTKKITLSGNVTIILEDGKTMTVTTTGSDEDFAIYGEDCTLNIYGQSAGTGKLDAKAAAASEAIHIEGNSSLGIHGGVVNADAIGNANASTGIVVRSYTTGNSIVIDGGKVTATGKIFGIVCAGGNFNITGGQVTAAGSNVGLAVCDYEGDHSTIPGILTLGCTNATDSITITGGIYNYSSVSGAGEVKIVDGITLTDDVTGYFSGTLSQNTINSFTGTKTLTLASSKEYNNITFYSWKGKTSLPTTAGNYYLAEDVKLSTTWTVPTGTVNLDLNGHSIKIIGSGKVISVPQNATLNMYDSGTGEHKYEIFDDYAHVDDSLTEDYKTFTGGYITGGKNSGVNISAKGTFMLYGGTIIGNYANSSDYGGGVSVDGTFEMHGGSIIGNRASSGSGGGVYVAGGKFTMSGGRIIDNYARYSGGGVCFYNTDAFIVSGTPVIKNNTVNGTANNVYIPSGILIKYSSLSTGAEIGVTMQTAGLILSNNATEAYTNYFTSDDGNYEVAYKEGYLELVPHTHSFTYTASGDTISATCTATNCALHTTPATLTIGKPAHATYGDGKAAAATITDANSIQGDATVVYYKAKSDGTRDGSALAEAPTDAGKYRAEITLGTDTNSATAYVVYDIEKADYPDTFNTVIGAETTDTGIKITSPYDENGTYEYKLGDGDWQKSPEYKKLKPGKKYEVYARVAATDNVKESNVCGASVWTDLTVTISGIPCKGQCLTAEVGAEDTGILKYQWCIKDVEEGSSYVDILGSVANKHTIIETEVGKKLKVKVEMKVDGNVVSWGEAETPVITDCAHTRTIRKNYRASTCTSGGYSGDLYCADCSMLLEEGHTLPASHSLSSYVSSKPTCTEPGQRIYTCSVCNYSYKEDIPALGHEPDEEVEETIKEATCTENGQIDVVVYCKRCNYEISRYSRTVWALGHEPAEAVRENETEATCEEDGSYDEVVYCSRCGYEISRYTKKIRALGHKYDPTTGLCPQCGQYDPSKFCTVMFNTDGGTAIPSQGIKPNGKATKPADPEKKGHTFKGWFVGNTEYDFDSVVTKSFTITAKWEINNYTVTFVTNCDTTIEPVTVAFNKTVSEPSGLTKEGYHLVEWQLDGKAFSFATPITDNITLTALWEIDKHTVTFVTDCDTTVEPIEVEHGKTAAIPRTPERTGHTFVEWQLDGTAYDFMAPVNADITLTAVWKINVYTVTFDSNGGSAVAAQKVEFGKTATKPDDPTRKKIAFLGWQLNGADYDFNTPVTSDITLVANWDIEKFTVTFDSNGGSAVAAQKVESGKTASEPAAPTREGYTFKGWLNGEKAFSFSTKITADITLTAKWEISKYTVNFDSNGGSAVAVQKVEHGKTAAAPTAPTKTGAEFIGWMLDGTAYDFATPVTGNITLTAQWKSAEFTVTFMFNGALHSTAKVEYGKKITFPKLTAGEGKIILAWYNDAALTSLFVTSTVVTSDLTLYAAEKEKAPVMENGEPVEGGVSGAIGGAAGENTTITLTSDDNAGKLTFPKSDDAKEITINGGGNMLEFTGSAAIKPNQELTLTDLTIKAEKDGKAQEIKLTAAKGGMTLENVTLDGKKSTINATKGDLTLGDIDATDLNVSGAKSTTLTVDGDVDATKISGFGTVDVEGALTIEKTLTINNLELGAGGIITVAKDASITINKGISGSGTIKLADGFKSITIKGTLSGKIKLISDKPFVEGAQIFKSSLTNLNDVFDVHGIAPAVNDGTYEYGLYVKGGKAYLRAFKLQLGDATFCEISDLTKSISNAKEAGERYTLNLLGDCDLNSLNLPKKGTYGGLTIDGNGHSITLKGNTLSLTGDLTLENVTIASAKGAWTIKTNGFTLTADPDKLINCTIK